jgi:thiamine biosynthesis lipoprotein
MAPDEVRVFPFDAMGSPCAIHLDADVERAEQAADEAMREIHRIEAKYSRYLSASLLSEINRQAALGGTIEVDDETAALIDYAAQCHRLSDGLFDITSGVLRKAWDFRVRATPDLERLPRLLDVVGSEKLKWSRPTLGFAVPGMEIDFGGIAKEYAVDRAVEICCSRGARACLVDLGGDIGVGGPHRDGSPWPIAIRSGRASSNVAFATIALSGGALASSGDYERFIELDGRRYSHILNPKTGWPVSGLASVTVAAGHCLAAGTCSTIAMLKGEEGARWLGDRNLAHAWIDQDGLRFATPPFELVD